MRKVVVLSLVLMLFSGLLFANGDGEDAGQGAVKKVEVRLLNNAGTNTEPGSHQVEYYDYIEELILAKYGLGVDFKVTMAGTSDIADMVNLLVASRQIDAWKFNKDPAMLSEEGFLAPLNNALDLYGENIKAGIIEQQKWDTVTFNGEIRAIPFYNGQIPNKGFWIRKDVMEEVGMTYSDVITISQLEEYLEKGKVAYPDSIPLGRTVRLYHWFAETMNALGEPVEKTLANGEPKPYLLGKNLETARYIWDDEYVKRLELLNSWWEKEYMHPEWFSWSRADAIAIVEQGVCLAVPGGWGRNGIFSNLYETQGQEWKFICVTQDDGRAVYHDRRNWDSVGFMVLNNRDEVVNGAVALIDMAFSDAETNFSMSYGQQGVHWDYDEEGYAESLMTEDGTFDEHNRFVNGVLRFTAGPFTKVLPGMMADQSTEYDTNFMMALEPSPNMVASSPADAWVNYGPLAQLIQTENLAYNGADAGTYIHEIELKATLGEISPREAQEKLQEYAGRVDFDSWWKARMSVFNASK